MLAAPLFRRAALIAAIAAPAMMIMSADLLAQEAPKPGAAAKRPAVVRSKGVPVEVKCNEEWKRATIRNTRGLWTLVAYETAAVEWVEPWRLRTPGSDYEIPSVPPNPAPAVDKDGGLGPPPRVNPGPPPTDRADAFAPLPIDWPVTPADASAVPEVAPAAAKWAYAPAAAAPVKLKDAPIPLLGGMQTDGGDSVIALEANGPVAFVAYQSKSDPKLPVVEVVDLAAGKPLARVELNPATRPLSVTPDGKRLVARAEGAYAGTMTRVDVWDLPAAVGREPAKHLVSFEPYAKEKDGAKDVVSAFAIDADRLITVNAEGSLVAWRVSSGSATPIWRTRVADADVALSPDRRAVAALGKTAMLLIDVETGKALGAAETPARSVDALSFRGDGQRLAALVGPTLYEFDLVAGKQTASIGLPPLGALLPTWAEVRKLPPEVRHLPGDVVLLAGALKISEADVAPKSLAVDVARGAFVAQYATPGVELTAVAGDRLAAFVRRGAQRQLASWAIAPSGGATMATVPDGAATRASIEIQVEADEFARRAISDSLRKQVAARGWTLVDPGQPANVRLVAKLESGRPEPQSFQSSIGRRETVDVTPRLSQLIVTVEGRTAWTTAAPPMPVVVPPGPVEVMKQAFVEAAQRPNIAFLRNAALPQTLFAPVDALPPAVSPSTLTAGVAAR